MPQNIEIKARIRDMDAVEALASRLSDGPGETLKQRDVFFHAPRQRLKLRFLAPDLGQLIAYERADEAGPKLSRYLIAPSSEPHRLEQVLEQALGVRAVVQKTRRLYRVGRTRIHLDRVEGLGPFLELEVVLREGETPEAGHAEARALMARLGVAPEDLVQGAYVDLLEKAP